jgi:hypothetical protein
MPRKTDASFRVKGCHLDGKSEGTFTVKAPTMTGVVFVTYRPKGSRREYTVMLQKTCEMVAARAAKQGTVYEHARQTEDRSSS